MGIGGWVKRKARKAKDKAKNAGKAVKNAVKKGAGKVGHVAEDAWRKTSDPMERLALKAEQAIREGMSEMDVRNMIRDELKGLKGSIKREVIDELRDEVLKPIPGIVTKAIPDLVTEKLPDMAEDVVKKALSEAFQRSLSKAFDTALDVIEVMAPDSYTFIAGAEAALIIQAEFTVSVEIPDPIAKLTEIRKYAKNPPKGRAEIMDCFRTFGPSSFTGEAKVSGNGGAATWSGDDKYDRIDAFLKKHGVN